MDVPPSRYRVEERGRRLVVIDRATGQTVTGAHPTLASRVDHVAPRTPPPPPMASPAPRPSDRAPPPPSYSPPPPRSGPAGARVSEVTTQPWYDDKAPRTLLLPESVQNTWLVVGAVLFTLAIVAWFLIGFIGFFVIAFLLLQKGTRTALRKAATGWLDQFDEA